MKKSGIILELYEEESYEARDEVETIQISMPIGADHKFLLEALADRFRVPMARIARPILEDGLRSCFLTLTKKDQDLVASVADKKINDFLEKSYEKMGGSYEHLGLGVWEGHAYAAQAQPDLHQEKAA